VVRSVVILKRALVSVTSYPTFFLPFFLSKYFFLSVFLLLISLHFVFPSHGPV